MDLEKTHCRNQLEIYVRQFKKILSKHVFRRISCLCCDSADVGNHCAEKYSFGFHDPPVVVREFVFS